MGNSLKKAFILLAFFVLSGACVSAQNGSVADSLIRVLATSISDTLRVNVLNNLARAVVSYPDSSFIYANQGLTLSRKIGYAKGTAKALGNIGEVYNAKGNYNLALKHLYDAYHTYEKLGEKKSMNSIMNSIGNTHLGNRDYQRALTAFTRCKEIATAEDDSKALALSYFGIGNIYNEMGNRDSAMPYLTKSLKMFSEEKFTYAEAMTFTLMGQIEMEDKNFGSSLTYLNKAMDLFKQLEQLYGMGVTYHSIGQTYYKMGDKKKALENYLLAYEAHLKRNAYDNLKETCSSISIVYKDLGDYKNALTFNEKYRIYNDSVFNEQSRKQLLEVETQYQTEKKEKEIQIKSLALEKSNQEVKNRTTFLYVFIGVSILFFIMGFFVYREYRQKKRANKEIILQKNIIEEKNKSITDSIRYAQYIQESILPDADTAFQHLRESFIFYRPKDIVSGDFYWIHSSGDFVYVAAVDCTGHGVPGAFMSMVGHNGLNNAIKQLSAPDTSSIMAFLQEEVTGLFRHNYSSATVRDGMDVSLVRIDRKNMQLQFSGAYNPLCIVRNKQLIEYKGDKKAVSAHRDQDGGFSKHDIPLEKGDSVYLFTDGYADQFGGPKGKKFKYKLFQQLLIENSVRPMNNQVKAIEETMLAWQGGLEQIDDILVIGFRI
ncbi:MAG: tetratricopeptide repeat protein [Bacteroidota bacterium]|nr:tetratricopeptide repeat protein [Bacteroidota bacterium]